MHLCKNDPTKSYKGDKPSPKGLGYCAHAEKLGVSKKGKDGNIWKIEATSKGVKRWVKQKAEKKSVKHDTKLLTNNELYKKIKEKFKDYKSYFIHNNYDKPFLVYIKNNDVHIYKKSNTYYEKNSKSSKIIDNKSIYIEFVKSYNYKKIFIGKSPKCESTIFSKGYGSKFDGNSILLQIDTNKYVFIGVDIYEFKIDDTINEYYSPVGNNDVPYPVALGSKNNYFMLDKTYVSNDKFKDLTKKNKIDLYSYYYGHSGYENLGKYAKKMKSVKIINEISI